MKLILSICAVISVTTMFANGLPSDDAEYGDLYGIFDAIIEQKFKCVREGVQAIKNENPTLGWWFEKIEELVERLYAKSMECAKNWFPFVFLKCIGEVKRYGKLEFDRLAEQLPQDQKHVAKTLGTVLKKCE